MSSNDCFDDLEQLEAFEATMTEELGWVASQVDSIKRVEGEQNSVESFDRSPDVQDPYDMQSGRNIAPASRLREGDIIDPFAAHDAGTCSCKSLAQIQASLKKTAAENRFVLTPDQLEEHAIKIDADNRKTHLFHDGQNGTQRAGSMAHSSRQQRSMTLPPLAPAPPNRQTPSMLPAPSATNSSSGRRSNSGALPSTAPSSEQYAYNPSMPGSRADQRPRG